jgi:hypothetical protein
MIFFIKSNFYFLKKSGNGSPAMGRTAGVFILFAGFLKKVVSICRWLKSRFKPKVTPAGGSIMTREK